MSKKNKKKRGPIRTILRILLILILVVVIAFGGLLAFITIVEYRPADREDIEITGTAAKTVKAGDTINFMTWNIGYGALGDNADFFMDGGKMVYTADKERLDSNLSEIMSVIKSNSPDILYVQEIDRDSSRSKHVNELEMVGDTLGGYSYAFALNFKDVFMPYPIPPMAKVDSGISTVSSYTMNNAERIQLPCPFSWPIRTFNLKRCVLISRIPVEGSDKELVLVNLHLEAYDDGEGKVEQTKMLVDILNSEKEKGNYVIAGGDFNQIFSSADKSAYPAQPGKWAAGEIDVSMFGEGWSFMMDSSVPSCRSLDQPYAGADKSTFQYYLIDGFIVSDDISVDNFGTQDLDFKVSDHNPVLMQVTLK